MSFINDFMNASPKLSGVIFLILTIIVVCYNVYEINSTKKEDQTSWYLSSVFKGWMVAFILLMFSVYSFLI